MLLSNLPSGMRYYLGAEARLRRSVEDVAMSVFEGWSYEEVLTPSVDYYALFEQGMGSTEAQSSFRFTDNDGRMLSLRPDVTSSVARVAATLLAERERPLRLCYAAPVFRQQQQSHAEWRRENTQLGCELIGAGGGAADLEVLILAAEILNRIGLANKFCITLNDVEIFNGLVADLNLETSQRETLRRLLDTRDASQLQRFVVKQSFPTSVQQSLLRFTQLTGKRAVLDEAQSLTANASSLAGIERLRNLWRVIESLELENLFEIDLADVSSLDYYTGLSFKVFVRGVGYRVGRGGRYDGLTASFGKQEPAVGFVLNLDSLVEVLGREKECNHHDNQTRYSIGAGDASITFGEAIKRRLANEQIRIELKV
ncbi:MAG TPA: ATP phosphoribosyltransferase regulatory subunit [Pyrinomonadaceae bacterium]